MECLIENVAKIIVQHTDFSHGFYMVFGVTEATFFIEMARLWTEKVSNFFENFKKTNYMLTKIMIPVDL